ncbi:hypothetical protein [Paenibacillus illinoisensis]|uniref:hypothetical protein n=1 Tax=Paenibacillus illinoisensis TaxID=59845 RepID=UPI00301CED39
MRIRTIAFKWHVEAPIGAVEAVIRQLGFQLKKPSWERKVGGHVLAIEHRARMSSSERSYFWLRFYQPASSADKTLVSRALSEWFYAMNGHFVTTVNWFQVAFDTEPIRTVHGYKQSSNSSIWTKVDKDSTCFSVYPLYDYFLFEVRNLDIRNGIRHQLYAKWLDEVEFNIQGNEKPDDQIGFNLVG